MTMITDILAGFAGWIIGVIVNYVADVLPLRRRLTQPFCVACDKPQHFTSYFLWPRQCPECGYRRLWRVWFVEIVYFLLAIWLWETPINKLGFLGGLLLLGYFGVVVIIDIEYRLIMHPVSIFGATLAFILGTYLHGLVPTLLGGLAGFGAMWLLFVLGELIIRFISRLRGQPIGDVALGFGDVNLSGVLGLLLGWPAIWVGLLLALLLGGIVSLIYLIVMLLRGKYQLFSALPYGPFLVAGAILLIYFRDGIIELLNH
jgi:leader peptidase (prepilin peptidase)/N-methyltransferase